MPGGKRKKQLSGGKHKKKKRQSKPKHRRVYPLCALNLPSRSDIAIHDIQLSPCHSSVVAVTYVTG